MLQLLGLLTKRKMMYHTHRPIRVCLSSSATSCDGSKIRTLLGSSVLPPNASDYFQTLGKKMVRSNDISFFLKKMLMLYQHSWPHFAHDTIPFTLSYFVETTISYVFYKLCITSLEPSILLPAFSRPHTS